MIKMLKQEYNIGQILFILSPKYNKVIPVKVTEHIISKTAEGEQSKYIVSPYFNKNKSYNLEQLAGTILFSTQEIYDYMLTRASDTIKNLIQESVENAKILGFDENLNIIHDNDSQITPQHTMVSPSEASSTKEDEEQITEQEAIVSPLPSSLPVPDTITLPDGTTAKVNIKS